MSTPPDGQGTQERVFCHECHQLSRRQEHGLTCLECGSDFVEIVSILLEPLTPRPLTATPQVENGNHPASPESPISDGGFNLGPRGFPGGPGPPDQFFPTGSSGAPTPFPPRTARGNSPHPLGLEPGGHTLDGNGLRWTRTGPNSVSVTGAIRAGPEHAPQSPLIGQLFGMLTEGLLNAGQQQQGPASNTRSYTMATPNGRATISYRSTTTMFGGPRDANRPGTPMPPVEDLQQ
jgi:hypothetical protein